MCIKPYHLRGFVTYSQSDDHLKKKETCLDRGHFKPVLQYMHGCHLRLFNKVGKTFLPHIGKDYYCKPYCITSCNLNWMHPLFPCHL